MGFGLDSWSLNALSTAANTKPIQRLPTLGMEARDDLQWAPFERTSLSLRVNWHPAHLDRRGSGSVRERSTRSTADLAPGSYTDVSDFDWTPYEFAYQFAWDTTALS
jgi:hypothetical protein